METSVLNHNLFRSFITDQTNYLRTSCENLKSNIEKSSDIPDDLRGELDVVVGQSELLIKERFSQFASLIDDSEFKRSEKEVMLEDLQGFWDIVMIQVEKIKQKIDELNDLKENNWKCLEKKPVLKKIENVKKIPRVAKTKTVPTAGSHIRSHILALRKEMKLKNKVKEITISTSEQDKENIVVNVIPPSSPPSCKNGDNVKVFDAGFFNISSPIRSSKKPKITPSSTLSSSKNAKKRLTPAILKDYTPCTRVTRSMKRSMEANRNRNLAF